MRAILLSGLVCVVDYLNDTLIMYTPGGALVDVWGGYRSAPGRFANPSRVAVGPAGSVYVTDERSHCVRTFTVAGNATAVSGVLVVR